MPMHTKNSSSSTAGAAAPLTKRQRECKHPPQYVHPTYDDRWETCDLCRIVRPRPIPAPWIVAHDESLPPLPAPALFAALEGTEEAKPEQPQKQLVIAAPKIAPEMETCPRCQGKRRVIEQPIFPHGAQPVKITCPRCRGAGKIVAYHVGGAGSDSSGKDGQPCAS